MVKSVRKNKKVLTEEEFGVVVSGIHSQFESLSKALNDVGLIDAGYFVQLGYDVFERRVFNTLKSRYPQG